MSWLKDLLKKAVVGVKVPQIVDFPVGQYKVYWEIFTSPVAGGISSTVRFIGYNDFPLREEFTIVGPTAKYVEERVSVLINDFMLNYTR